jgi:tetratricopeptide (TPR) repeat protein
VHNLHLHGMALMREGRLDDAGEKLRQAFETPGQNAIPEVFAHVPYLEYLLHVGRYEEALESADVLVSTHGPTGEVVGRVFNGEALLLLGRVEEAQEAATGALADLETLADRISGPNEAHALRRARSFASQLEGELALHSPDPTMLYAARQTLLPLARRLVNVAGFDGWGEGLLRLERMGRFARRAAYADLEDAIREQIADLDPGYTPNFDMPNSE